MKLTLVSLVFVVFGQGMAEAGETGQSKNWEGKLLARECAACHREPAAPGQVEGIPSINGWPIDQFSTVMKSYRAGQGTSMIMSAIAGSLSDQEITALAQYFHDLPLSPKSRKPAKR